LNLLVREIGSDVTRSRSGSEEMLFVREIDAKRVSLRVLARDSAEEKVLPLLRCVL